VNALAPAPFEPFVTRLLHVELAEWRSTNDLVEAHGTARLLYCTNVRVTGSASPLGFEGKFLV